MNIFFRVLLAVYAVCLSIVSALVMLVIFRPVVLTTIYEGLYGTITENRGASIIIFVIALAFFIVSLTFLFSGLKSNKDKKAVSKYTNIGEIKISLNTIENIALTASRRLNGVRDSKAYVFKADESVSIAIRAVVMPDINIPSLSEDIQAKVKKAVEESSGIGVADVKVIIDNVYSGSVYKARVE